MKIRVGNSTFVYWPVGLRKRGFVGPLEVILGASTAVLVKPEASLEDTIRSLSVTIKELKLRSETAEGRWE